MTIDHDLHVHTYLSDCCHDKEHHRPAEILAVAAEMGVRLIGFADHVWANPDLPASDWYRPQDASQISRLRDDLASVTTDVRVLVGCEAETVRPGQFGITREFAEQLDFVLLACSHFHMTGFVEQPSARTPRGLADHMLAFFRSAVTSGLATSIPHAFLPLGHYDLLDDAVATMSDGEFLDAFGEAADAGVGIEITVSYFPSSKKPSFSIETPMRVLSLARQAGCRFTFGSDAHDGAAQRRLPNLARFVEPLDLTPADLHPITHQRHVPRDQA